MNPGFDGILAGKWSGKVEMEAMWRCGCAYCAFRDSGGAGWILDLPAGLVAAFLTI
jgi:hypothetical protein